MSSVTSYVRPTPPQSSRVAFHELITLWQDHETRRIHPIGRLRYDGATYSFTYVQGFQDTPALTTLPGLSATHTTHRSETLFPAFAGRIMRPTRRDFVDYLTRLGLDEHHSTPWEQITYGGGRRNGDTFQFQPMPVLSGETLHARCLVNGIRHLPGDTKVINGREQYIDPQQHEAALEQLERGDVLSIVSEPTNSKNSKAALVVKDLPLGYVPDVLTQGLDALSSEGVDVHATVAHINPAYGPAHLRLAVNLEWHDAPFNPFSNDPALQPLAGDYL